MLSPAGADRRRRSTGSSSFSGCLPSPEVLQKADVRLGLEFLGPLYMRQPSPDGPPRVPFIWTLPETLALAGNAGRTSASSWTCGTGITRGEPLRTSWPPRSPASSTCTSPMRSRRRLKTCATTSASCPVKAASIWSAFLQALRKIGYEDGVSPEPLGRIPADMPPEEAARLGAGDDACGHEEGRSGVTDPASELPVAASEGPLKNLSPSASSHRLSAKSLRILR